MAKEKLQKINYYLLFIYLILSPFIDVINAFMQRIGNINISIGMLYKGLLLAYLLGYYLGNIKKDKTRKYFLIYLGIVILWGILFFRNRFSLLTLNNIYHELIYLLKIFYLPFLLYLLYFFIEDNAFSKKKIKKILIISFFIYVFLLMIPYLTDTAFYTYGYKDYGGFVGWFYAANEISIIMVLLFFTTLNEAYNYKKYYLIPLSIGLFFMLQIGTKVIILGLILAYIFFIIKNLFKKEYANLLFTVVLIILTIFIYNHGFMGQNVDILISNGEEIIANTPESEENNQFIKLLNLVLSSRYEYLQDTLKIYRQASFQDKIWGIGYTNTIKINDSKIEKLIEIDLLDIYFHLGIIGFLIYVIYFVRIIYLVFKEIIKKKQWNWEIMGIIYLIMISLLISLTAGHVLTAPSVAMILSIMIILLSLELKKSPINK